jgi:hypothetical protein
MPLRELVHRVPVENSLPDESFTYDNIHQLYKN